MIDFAIWFGGWQGQLEIVILVAMALLLGGVVGFERTVAEKSAGLRTHMLVAGAACLLVGLGDLLAVKFSDTQYGELLRIDPIRIIQGVVTGVSFLGAGMIFRHAGKDVVEGLTTAASLLMVAAIGIAVGLRQIVLAVATVVLLLLVLRVVRWLKKPGKRKVDELTGANED